VDNGAAVVSDAEVVNGAPVVDSIAVAVAAVEAGVVDVRTGEAVAVGSKSSSALTVVVVDDTVVVFTTTAAGPPNFAQAIRE
jgi:hypothetical protein